MSEIIKNDPVIFRTRNTNNQRCPKIKMQYEGPEKTTRGGEWETIKIPHENLAYVPNLTQRASFLTRLRPHSYRKAIGPQNQVRQPRNTVEDNTRCKQGHVRDYGKQKQTTSNSSPFVHFTEQLICVTEKSQKKHNESCETSSL
jgi:hypothetical protein